MSRPTTFASRLLGWWDAHGRKDLPWQHPRTPYRVWVSEIMLQQTQVTTVIPYFERWMQRFPGIPELAAAPLDEVLTHWAGLGYYARARNLHKAAQLCLEKYAGDLPSTAAELAALPGIGLSTANAIVSQASDVPAAVLDGNVRRVLARHAMIEGWTGSPPVQQSLWAEAESRLPAQRGADYTQAIMDLGAMVCIRSKPDCPQCPVRGDCKALAADSVTRFPAPKPKTKVTDRAVFMLIARDAQHRVLMEKRPPAGIWGGLWCLPESDSLVGLEEKTGLALDAATRLTPREHRLTHLRMVIQPVMVHSARPTRVRCDTEQRWIAPEAGAKLGVPKPVADLLGELLAVLLPDLHDERNAAMKVRVERNA